MPEGLEGLLAGRTLVKRYEIGEVIGRGGFAVVYRATDVRLGRPVAVKVITLTAHDDDARALLRERLHREARAAAGLPHHPNLVTVHDVGTDPELGLDFLVMELLSGENLSEYLSREGKPPLPLALRVLAGAAAGIAVGHRAGLVHRDVKPGNLFLAPPHDDESGPFRVCVLDYGIAQAMEDDATMTRGEAAPLSPAFASPEQLRGERDPRPSSDVFSLGVVGYQLLTGERPFSAGPGQAPTGWTVRSAIRDLNPEVPAAVEAVLMRAMREDPAQRFPDADAFGEALDRALRGDAEGETLAYAPSGVAAAVAVDEDDRTLLAPPSAAAPAAPRVVAPPKPRRRGMWPAALVAALLVAAVAAWAALSGGGGGPADGGPTDTTAAVAVPDEGETEDGEEAPALPSPFPGDEPAGTPGGTEPSPPGAGEGAPAPSVPVAPSGPGAGEPADPATPASPQPQPPEPRQPSQPQPQRPEPEPSPPPAENPRTPENPAQPPVNPPRPVPEPVQPVIVQPRPAPPDTVRIGPPR